MTNTMYMARAGNKYFTDQRVKTTLCKRCAVGKVLSGEQSVYNAKNAEGQQVCSDCFLKEIYDRIGE